jgi:membrane associated rhomboid family serine protease
LIDRPVSTGCIVLLLAAFSMNYTIKDCTNKLGLVSVNTFIADTQIWNLLTSQFYEENMLKLALDIIGLVIITKSVKIKGGYKIFGLFFILCALSCSLFTSAYCFIRYFSTGREEMITNPIYGFSGIFMTMITYVRQQAPDEPFLLQLPNITNNNLPVLMIIAQSILWLVGLKVMAIDFPFSIIAMLFSWSYLRFFYRFNDGDNDESLLGDRTDDFAFVNMFPKALHLIVIPMCTAFYNIFAMIGIFPELELQEEKSKRQHHLHYIDSSPTESLLPPSPNKSNADLVQERRRAKAMKLLDAKMAELSSEGDESWEPKHRVEDLEIQ